MNAKHDFPSAVDTGGFFAAGDDLTENRLERPNAGKGFVRTY